MYCLLAGERPFQRLHRVQSTPWTVVSDRGSGGYRFMNLVSRNGQGRCQMPMSFLADFLNSITAGFQMGKSYFSTAISEPGV